VECKAAACQPALRLWMEERRCQDACARREHKGTASASASGRGPLGSTAAAAAWGPLSHCRALHVTAGLLRNSEGVGSSRG
jgi:hypothetical protein